MAYTVLDLELGASSMLDEHSPTDMGVLLLLWSVGGGNPGALAKANAFSTALALSPSLAGSGASSPTDLHPQPFANLA